MSKVDGPRAIREARHAAYRAAQSKTGAAAAASPRVAGSPVADGTQPPKPAGRKKTPKKATAVATAADTAAVPVEAAESVEAVKSVEAEASVEAVDSGTEALCGHRSMNGRSCRRPAGHSEKSHRYS